MTTEDEKKLRKLRKRAEEYGYAVRRYGDGYNFLSIYRKFFLPLGAMSLEDIEEVIDDWDAQNAQDDEDD